jgi:YHS domain-containing protein
MNPVKTQDPVCGLEIGTGHAAGRMLVAGTMHYFCSRICLQRFRQNPEPYLVQEEVGAGIRKLPAREPGRGRV